MMSRPARRCPESSLRLRAKRRRLLAGAALASLWTSLEAAPARAQAINATPSTTAGTVTYSRISSPTPGSETIFVQSPSAIINWTPPAGPLPNPYVYLPGGNIVTFTNGANPGFVVLNRILTTIPSRFDGTVLGRLNSNAGQIPGGGILFSSPGGIIVGTTGFFDVGSLVLTTLNVVESSPGNFITPSGGFQLSRGNNPPDAAVVTEAGSDIFAGGPNSAVVLVAPRVIHGGSTYVNGSTAYIAADDVEFSVNQGLFDIKLTMGTDNATPIIHTGSTGGPASLGGADNHRINAVALARNQAITMLLQGSIGYDAASGVVVENGVIVLSAGHNLAAGGFDPAPPIAPPAHIQMSDGTFTSNTFGRATGNITGAATTTDPLAFQRSLGLRADNGSVAFTAGPGASVTVGENLNIDALTIDLAATTVEENITLNAGGDIDIGSAQAGDDFNATAGGAFTAGTVAATGDGRDDEENGANIAVTATGDTTLNNGDAENNIFLTSIDGNVLSSTLLNAGGDISLIAGQGVDITDGTAGGAIALLSGGGDIDAEDLVAFGSVVASTGNNVTIATVDAGGNLEVTASGVVDLGTVIADVDITIGGPATSVTIASGTAGDDFDVISDGDVAITSGQAADQFSVNAGGAFIGGTINNTGLGTPPVEGQPFDVGTTFIAATGDLRLDNADAAAAIILASQSGNILSDGLLDAGTFLRANAGLDVDINDANAGGAIDLGAGDDIDTSAMNAGGAINTNAVGDTTIVSADSGASITILAGGVVDIGTLVAVNDVLVDPVSISIVSVTAGDDIDLTASGDITVGFADAGDDFTANAGTTFDGGTVIARGIKDDESSGGPLFGGNIFVDAFNDLRLGNGDAAADIQLISRQGSLLSDVQLTAGSDIRGNALVNIDIADADAGDSIDLNAGGFINAASLTTMTGSIFTSSVGNTTVAAASSGDSIDANAGATADFGTTSAATDIVIDAADIVLTDGTAGRDISLSATASIDVSVAQAGDDFTAFASDLFNGTNIVATGLGADNEVAPSPLFGSNISVNAQNDLRLDDGTAPDRIDLRSIAGSILSDGTLTADQLVANAAINIALHDIFVVTALDLATPGGSISGNSFNSDADITLNAAQTVTLASATSGGDIVIDAGGNLRLDNGIAPGLIDLDSTGGSVLSSGGLTANQLLADAAANIAVNNVNVVAALNLTTANGSISGNAFTSTSNIVLSSTQNVTLASANSGGLIQVGANANATLGAATAATDINVTGAQINLANGNAGRDITLGSSGTVTVGTANAANRFIAVSAGNGTFTNLSGGASVAVLSVNGSARFNGAVAAPTIVINSNDIDIAAGATIGNSATQTVSLTSRPNGLQTTLGGSTQSPGYTLADAEADRITAVTLNIQAFPTSSSPTRAPDLLIRDLSLSGQQIGTLRLNIGGFAQVDGALLLAAVRANGGIGIQATERLQVVTPSGSIRVRDAAGLTDGTLTIASNNIWSATQSLLDQLRTDSNFAGRDQALLVNAGAVEPRGSIEAGDVVLSARDSLFVQNSGNFLAFAGITVRESTLSIVPTGTQPLRVFAFGRRINPDGSFVTNLAFFNEVDYQDRNGVVGYTDDAQLNLCFINTGVCRLPTPDNPLPGGPEIIEEPVDSSTPIPAPGSGSDLVDTSFADEPLIEEPVTSGGDSILWDCDNDDDGDCDEDDYDG